MRHCRPAWTSADRFDTRSSAAISSSSLMLLPDRGLVLPNFDSQQPADAAVRPKNSAPYSLLMTRTSTFRPLLAAAITALCRTLYPHLGYTARISASISAKIANPTHILPTSYFAISPLFRVDGFPPKFPPQWRFCSPPACVWAPPKSPPLVVLVPPSLRLGPPIGGFWSPPYYVGSPQWIPSKEGGRGEVERPRGRDTDGSTGA